MGACKEASYPGSVKESLSGHKPGVLCSRQREKHMQKNNWSTDGRLKSVQCGYNSETIRGHGENNVKETVSSLDLPKYLVEAHCKTRKNKCPFLCKHRGFFANK